MEDCLNPDGQNFKIALKASIYVDKTGLIELTNSRIFAGDERFVCVARPRRFGKSMAANMLVAYYSKGCQSKELFDGLEISRCADFEEHLNRYNVIRLVMTDFLDSSKSMKDIVNDIAARIIREIKRGYSDIQFKESDLGSILEQTSKESGMPFIFVIDEWDCVFRERRNDVDGQNDYLKFLRDLLKDKSYVALCYMTGILPIKKYGSQSALNMFKEISMTDAGAFAKYTGFTEDEVKALCDKYGRSYEGFKDWYNGYNVKGMAIYNPKSVVESLMDDELQSYWTTTETYEALKIYIDTNMGGVKDAITKMLGGEKVKIDTSTFTNDMVTFTNCDDVLTLLIHLGYLTYEKKNNKEMVWIPNREVRQQFVSTIKTSHYGDVAKMLKSSDDLLEATLAMDGEKVASLLDKAHSANTSILTYNDENSLSCVITIAYYAAAAYYGIEREMPAGKGFADMVFIPKATAPGYPAMVVELKYDKTVESAISQIKKKSYVNALNFYKGDILLVGINYDKETKDHTCVIEKVKK